ncbi:MAG TPA: DUF4136 domain-containing protein [Longimicrobiales bacterium]|nr:DUF4136 domain-containing protein [Longimicrobiales bacterium]
MTVASICTRLPEPTSGNDTVLAAAQQMLEQEVFEADREAGYDSEHGEGTQVLQYEEATFLVDLADARTKEIVWRGWARLDLGRALSDPDAMRDQIDEAIRKMFESFPIPPGAYPVPPGAVAPAEGR